MLKKFRGGKKTVVVVNGKSYELKKKLGEGGYAEVFRAQDKSTGNVFALKRMNASSPSLAALAEEEISLMRNFPVHENLVRYFDSEVGPTEARVLMEYCPGGSLADLVEARREKRQCLSPEEILHIFTQIVSGVHSLHCLRPPVAHRDVKAENVLCGQDGLWKLCDFNSCVIGPRFLTDRRERAAEADVIDRRCTLFYCAPEMVDLDSTSCLDERVDVWALGCLLYMLMFLRHPFMREAQGANPKLAIINRQYDRPKVPEHPNFLFGLLDMCLSPAEVRPSAGDLLAHTVALREGLVGGSLGGNFSFGMLQATSVAEGASGTRTREELTAGVRDVVGNEAWAADWSAFEGASEELDPSSMHAVAGTEGTSSDVAASADNGNAGREAGADDANAAREAGANNGNAGREAGTNNGNAAREASTDNGNAGREAGANNGNAGREAGANIGNAGEEAGTNNGLGRERCLEHTKNTDVGSAEGGVANVVAGDERVVDTCVGNLSSTTSTVGPEKKLSGVEAVPTPQETEPMSGGCRDGCDGDDEDSPSVPSCGEGGDGGGDGSVGGSIGGGGALEVNEVDGRFELDGGHDSTVKDTGRCVGEGVSAGSVGDAPSYDVGAGSCDRENEGGISDTIDIEVNIDNDIHHCDDGDSGQVVASGRLEVSGTSMPPMPPFPRDVDGGDGGVATLPDDGSEGGFSDDFVNFYSASRDIEPSAIATRLADSAPTPDDVSPFPIGGPFTDPETLGATSERNPSPDPPVAFPCQPSPSSMTTESFPAHSDAREVDVDPSPGLPVLVQPPCAELPDSVTAAIDAEASNANGLANDPCETLSGDSQSAVEVALSDESSSSMGHTRPCSSSGATLQRPRQSQQPQVPARPQMKPLKAFRPTPRHTSLPANLSSLQPHEQSSSPPPAIPTRPRMMPLSRSRPHTITGDLNRPVFNQGSGLSMRAAAGDRLRPSSLCAPASSSWLPSSTVPDGGLPGGSSSHCNMQVLASQSRARTNGPGGVTRSVVRNQAPTARPGFSVGPPVPNPTPAAQPTAPLPASQTEDSNSRPLQSTAAQTRTSLVSAAVSIGDAPPSQPTQLTTGASQSAHVATRDAPPSQSAHVAPEDTPHSQLTQIAAETREGLSQRIVPQNFDFDAMLSPEQRRAAARVPVASIAGSPSADEASSSADAPTEMTATQVQFLDVIAIDVPQHAVSGEHGSGSHRSRRGVLGRTGGSSRQRRASAPQSPHAPQPGSHSHSTSASTTPSSSSTRHRRGSFLSLFRRSQHPSLPSVADDAAATTSTPPSLPIASTPSTSTVPSRTSASPAPQVPPPPPSSPVVPQHVSDPDAPRMVPTSTSGSNDHPLSIHQHPPPTHPLPSSTHQAANQHPPSTSQNPQSASSSAPVPQYPSLAPMSHPSELSTVATPNQHPSRAQSAPDELPSTGQPASSSSNIPVASSASHRAPGATATARCPICGIAISGNNDAVNAHVDQCLAESLLRPTAQASSSATSTVAPGTSDVSQGETRCSSCQTSMLGWAEDRVQSHTRMCLQRKCPICGCPLTGTLADVNSHLDTCISQPQ